MDESGFARQFVTPGESLDTWDRISPYFDALEGRDVNSPAALERWLNDCSELCAGIQEVGTHRHVQMTCKTDDPERKAAFLDFIENIEPKCKPRYHRLDLKYVECPHARGLPRDRYHVLDRSVRARVDLFREENVPLQTEDAKLAQRYQEIGGGQTVTFDGKEQTLQQLARYYEETDRSVRQGAWEAETRRRLDDVDKLEDIFDHMVRLRDEIARNAGCRNFMDYAFRSLERFDYTPDTCVAFHDAAEEAVVPVVRRLQETRRTLLGVDPLRPWDLSVDVHGRPPLRPFGSTQELCHKVRRVFDQVDPELGAQFGRMDAEGYLDLDSRKGKAPGGYQATYDEQRHPFIFMNAVGLARDVRTLIHEGGHAFHCYAARNDPLLAYRSSPIEFAEVASMGLELLALDYLGAFYHGADLARARRDQFEGITNLLPWVATVDAFQHFVYTHADHSRDDRRRHWIELRDRFGGIADYAGHEDALAYAWHKQLHLFEVPFYYIEYAIAQLGALQVWRNARTDRAVATRQYRDALAFGGGKPLPELFRIAGADFDFSARAIQPLMELVEQELSDD